MNTPRKVVLVTTVFGVALTGALAKSAYGLASSSDAPQSTPTKTPVAGPDRPANVPDGYVITPFGYFHPSCVQSLAKGERLMADGRLQHANGSVQEKAGVCNYPTSRVVEYRVARRRRKPLPKSMAGSRTRTSQPTLEPGPTAH